MANSIISASKRGAELTHGLLAFSRQQPLHPNALNLGALCEGMCNLLRRTLGETIKIDIVSQSNLWNVSVDAGQVENALLNLAINASHAMPEGGNLEIIISNAIVVDQNWLDLWDGQPGEYVTLRVSDTGTGMSENVLRRAFEPFYTTKTNDRGSGLGLSMVHGFTKQSGGFATIESVEGDGATVTIYLSKDNTSPNDQQSTTDEIELFKGHGETILLVEDEAAVRLSSTKLLTMLGYEVLIAQDGDTALKVASTPDNIDILISDMVLPGHMNGVEIFEQIVRQRPEIKCIFMSGYAAMADKRLPLDTELILKPYQMHVLAKKLRQLCVA
jgi:CheY-like chemotaxis protein/anti-sigma regulatory factor (Ser/Thr protein kinase)